MFFGSDMIAGDLLECGLLQFASVVNIPAEIEEERSRRGVNAVMSMC